MLRGCEHQLLGEESGRKRWYTELLGVEPYFERGGGYYEFRVGDFQHELGLNRQPLPPDRTRPSRAASSPTGTSTTCRPASSGCGPWGDEYQPPTERGEGFNTRRWSTRRQRPRVWRTRTTSSAEAIRGSRPVDRAETPAPAVADSGTARQAQAGDRLVGSGRWASCGRWPGQHGLANGWRRRTAAVAAVPPASMTRGGRRRTRAAVAANRASLSGMSDPGRRRSRRQVPARSRVPAARLRPRPAA